MTDDLLNKLFEQARNQTSETKVEEVAGWVSVAAGLGTVGFLSLLKLKLLTKKGIMYLGSIFLGAGIGITALINLQGENKTSNKLPSHVVIDKPNKPLESAVLYDTIEEKNQEPLSDENKVVKESSIYQKANQLNRLIPIDNILVSPVLVAPPLPGISLAPPSVIPPKVLKKDVSIQDRVVGKFTKLNVSSAFEIEIKQGTSHAVRVEASDKIIDEISTKTVGEELIIELMKNYKSTNDGELKVFITVVDLNEIKLSGAVKIISIGDITSENFKIRTSGSSNIELTLTSKKIDVGCSGASDLKLNGKTTFFTLQTSGATKVYCAELEAETVEIESSGASDVYVKVTSKLDVQASGSSKIRYQGSPADIEINSSGASSIKKL